MTGSLFDGAGHRKYLTAHERRAFMNAALRGDVAKANFCAALALTGARISEVLNLTHDRVDIGNRVLVLRTLKQRNKVAYRAIPIPNWLLIRLREMNVGERLWPWGRTTAWKLVKKVMLEAGIEPQFRKPKALRHAFAVDAGLHGVPMCVVQRWLGHARIETTAIYSLALGPEERELATRTWTSFRDESVN